MIEVIEAARPSGPGSSWPAWSASARSEIGRFHNPNPDQIQSLLRDTVGLSHITNYWSWRNCTPPQAEQRLREALRLRHEIAHGLNPIPKVHNTYASRLPGFIRKLAECTDRAIADHAGLALNIQLRW